MQEWASILSAIGAVVVALGGREILAGWLKKRSGKADEETKRVKDIIDQNHQLRKENDAHYTKERIFKEYASQLRIQLLEAKVPPAEIPPWPIEKD